MGEKWLGLVAVGLGACVGPGFFSDGSSISVGGFNRGSLRRGLALAPEGEGYRIPRLWAERGLNYGTEELVGALERASKRVALEYPGGKLGIADLSLRSGGDSVYHRSHENGRDVDLIYYAVDFRGKPVPPPSAMPRYPLADGRSFPARKQDHGVVFEPFSQRWFDAARNWAVVRALLEDPVVEVQYIFINRGIRARLLEHAATLGEDEALIERAAEIMRQPGDSLPHDDHMHVRLYCAPSDRALGCEDRGPLRWWKKRYKYMPPGEVEPPDEQVGALAAAVGFSLNWPALGLFP